MGKRIQRLAPMVMEAAGGGVVVCPGGQEWLCASCSHVVVTLQWPQGRVVFQPGFCSHKVSTGRHTCSCPQGAGDRDRNVSGRKREELQALKREGLVPAPC